MKWKRGKGGNRDVVDVRGARGSGGGPWGGGLGGGGFPIPGGIGRMGGGAGIVAVIVIVLINVLGSSGGGGFEVGNAFGPQATAPGAAEPAPIPRSEDPDADLKDFSVYVFEDVQSTWQKTFAAAGRPYDRAKLVLYSGAVSTGGCGSATSAVGPFYCPGDESVYLDLSFYKQMADQLGASGDFAWAYVIAHEMGHHVQNESGTTAQVEQAGRDEQGGAEGLSVRTELQADCYAGVWASTVYAEGDLDEGDIQEAFGAARSVGDDRLQKQATGTVNPDTFTHGTSQQRRAWFDRGYRTADPGRCDTFSADEL
ncbi:MAG TPA: neutral zinc metallopeptidase [Solirubrobacterales bacterium]|nr:neutral zinc metallopeptidase [Solirubrobacterales bacterium]